MKALVCLARGVQIFILRQLVRGISQLAEEPSVTFRKSRRTLPDNFRFECHTQDEIRANHGQITNTNAGPDSSFEFDEALALQSSERHGHGIDANFKAFRQRSKRQASPRAEIARE
jgi:hypothetical protein